MTVSIPSSNEESSFQRSARVPRFWLTKAEGLRYSAHIIWNHYWDQQQQLFKALDEAPEGTGIPGHLFPGQMIFPSAMLLMGLALENLVKGILIKRKPELVASESIHQSITSNHKLLPLFSMARINLTEKQRSFLERVSHFVTWSGKYPFPKEADQNKGVARTLHGTDMETFTGLFGELKKEIGEQSLLYP